MRFSMPPEGACAACRSASRTSSPELKGTLHVERYDGKEGQRQGGTATWTRRIWFPARGYRTTYRRCFDPSRVAQASGTARAQGCCSVMIASTASRAPAPSDRVYVFVSDD